MQLIGWKQVKGKWLYLIGIIVLVSAFLLFVGQSGEKAEYIRIGVPDGAAGLLARYVIDEKVGREVIRDVRFEPYTLYDCCGSASQYAMGSGHLDVAILCPEAARELVERDKSFEIAGPVTLNSDVLITHPDADLSKPRIAVSQKRRFQKEIVRKRFGEAVTCEPMFHGAVPFAFAKDVVQGAVIDITKSFSLQGEMVSAAMDGDDVCTYVLVTRKTLRENANFSLFLDNYRSAVQEMENDENLLRLMKTYVSAEITSGDIHKWKKMNVRFTFPSSSPPRG